MQYVVMSLEGARLNQQLFIGTLSECFTWVEKYTQHENFLKANEQDPYPGMFSWNTKHGIITLSLKAEAEKTFKFLRSIKMDYDAIEEFTETKLNSTKG